MQMLLPIILSAFLRRYKTHLVFIAMLASAFVIPIAFTILLSSAQHGMDLQSCYITGDSDYRIGNANEDDLPSFSGMEEVEARYDGGYIYININKTMEDGQRTEVRNKILRMAAEVGNGRLLLDEVTFDTSAQEHFFAQWLFMIVILTALSMLVIQVAYSSHIGNFKYEIGLLMAIGASTKQIKRIYYAELLISAVLAYAIALTVSHVSMKVLFNRYLQVEDTDFYTWMVYKFDVSRIAMLFTILLGFITLLYALVIRKTISLTPVKLLSSTINDDKLRKYGSTFSFSSNSSLSMAKVLLRRSSRVYAHGLTIAVPVLALSIFVYNYAVTSTGAMTENTGFDASIRKNPESGGGGYFNLDSYSFDDAEIRLVEEMQSIIDISYDTIVVEGEYVVHAEAEAADGEKHAYPFISIEDDSYLITSIRMARSTLDGDAARLLGNQPRPGGAIPVAVNKNYLHMKTSVGDEFILYHRAPREKQYEADGGDHADFDGFITVKVALLLDLLYADDSLALYFSDDDFTSLIGSAEPNVMNIKLDKTADAGAFVSELRSRFPDTRIYGITNEREIILTKADTSTGAGIFVDGVLFIVFFFMLFSMYMIFTEYAIRQGSNVELLFLLGAEKDTIRKVYLLQTGAVLIFCLLLSFSTGLGATYAFFYGSGYHVVWDAKAALFYALAVLLAGAAFLMPVRLGIDRHLARL